MFDRRNKTLCIVIFSILAMMSVLLMSGCSQTEEDPYRTAITKVLEHQFNGPDEKFMELLWNPKYTTVVNNKEENKEFDKYVAEVYGPYFTDSELDLFIAAFATSYQSRAFDTGHKLSLKDITIEQSDKISNRYTFIAKVGYQKNGDEEKIANVEGEVLFSTKEDGKIGRFSYGDDDGLLR